MPESFVNKFLAYTKDAESPTSYLQWAAYTTLAAILRDNCYVLTNDKPIYPNIFTVILSAHAGNTRKSIPLSKSIKLVRAANNTHIVQGRASIRGIFNVLAEAHTNGTGEVIKGASGFLYSEELTSFLYREPGFLDILNTWYDYHENWDLSLSVDGVNKLEKVCITLLSATNEALVNDFYESKQLKGGLLSRTIIVREEKRRFLKSFFIDIEDKTHLWEWLVKYVKNVAQLRGAFKVLPDAKQEFDDWYNTLTDDKLGPEGIESRVPTNVVKLAMIKSVSESLEKIITKDHMLSAIDEIVGLLKNYKFLTLGTGAQVNSKVAAQIVTLLYNSPNRELTSRKILQRLIGDLDKETFDKIIVTYIEADLIEIVGTTMRDGILYRLTERMIEMLDNKIKGEKRDD